MHLLPQIESLKLWWISLKCSLEAWSMLHCVAFEWVMGFSAIMRFSRYSLWCTLDNTVNFGLRLGVLTQPPAVVTPSLTLPLTKYSGSYSWHSSEVTFHWRITSPFRGSQRKLLQGTRLQSTRDKINTMPVFVFTGPLQQINQMTHSFRSAFSDFVKG